VIPSGTTYYINSVLDFSSCSGCDFQIEGTLKFASDTDYWEGRTAMMYVKGVTGMTMRSLTGSGVINGNGQDAYDLPSLRIFKLYITKILTSYRYDLFASDSSYQRPTLLYITSSSNIKISGLTQKNPPNVFNSVTGSSSDIHFSDLTMTATSKSTNAAKNTDGFDIGSCTTVSITSVSVVNDDDCVAFKPGANYVTVSDITCTGSHGLSVGSLGSSGDDTVKNVYVSGATMINSTKAAGIKTYPSGGDHGLSTVTNVTWSGVVVDGCDYAIQIQSCYGEDASYCEENPGDAVLTDVVFEGFSGTTSGKYGDVTGNMDCGADGTCGVTVSDYTILAPDGESEVLCANTDDLGVTCTSGASG
jgi:polygalacturonase